MLACSRFVYNRARAALPSTTTIGLKSRAYATHTAMSAHPFPGALGDDEGWNHAEGKHGRYSVFTKHIERSQQDDREYRLIRLANGLQAMLVHDATADKAAASIDIGVGHLHDPDDMPGLAHFCEHLLFMGTEQYPKENEYSEYLSRNSGHSNAFTSTMNTNYYFNVAPGAFAGAIQRFAGFFHSPLFAPSCTLRELNAVDSEHKKNHQSDLWRIYQVNKHLSRPGHPWNKFGTGNKDSLTRVGRDLKAKQSADSSNNLRMQALSASTSAAQSLAPSAAPSRAASPAPSISSIASDTEADGGVVGRETRRRLVEWWSKEYCAGRMRLAVIGKDSLDDLTELVVKNFSPILNRGQEPLPLILQNPFGSEEKGTLVSVQTIMSFHCMEISWPLDWQPPLWEHKPGLYLSDLLGHEGPGSLHSYLKSKGWITELVAGPQSLARGFQMFRVTLHMTADGFQHYRQLMLAVFDYISLLKSSAIELWHQHEVAQISDMRFRFQEKRQPQDTAVSLSQQLAMPYPRELVMKAGSVTLPWSSADGEGPAAALQLLSTLNVEGCRTVLMGRKDEHDKVSGEQEWQTEPIYGTQFRVQPYDAEFMRQAAAPNQNGAFGLPKPNDFIPQNLDVNRKAVAEPQKRPHLIKETPLYSLWYKRDDQYWVPKAHALIELRTPVINASPKSAVLSKIYSELVTDSLTEYAYAADLAGLAYNFLASTSGMYLFVSGYNDKLHVLLRAILERVKGLRVAEDRFEVVRERIERDWKNFSLGQTYKISDYYGRYMMNKSQWTVQDKLDVLPSVTVSDVQNFVAEFSSSFKAQILVAGNLPKEDALNLAKMIEDTLGATPLSEPEPTDIVLLLPEGCNYMHSMPVPNKDEPNSALTYYVHFGQHTDPRTRVRNALLTQIMSEPAFNVLRTKEQLGYIVSAGQWVAPGQAHSGLRIVVQSERGPVYLENRVEAFLEHMQGVLEDMSVEQFAEQKAGLQSKWREAPKNLGEETSRYWNHIDSGFLDFLRRENDATLLDDITKEEIIAHFMKHVHPSSPTRSKLSLHLRSQKPRAGHISRPAADAFDAAARAAGVPVDDISWRDELYADGEPTAPEFAKFWQSQPAMGSVAPVVAAQLLGAMQKLVMEYPAEKDAEGEMPAGVTKIEDMEAFRRSLREAEQPHKPLVDWKDLPTSHL